MSRSETKNYLLLKGTATARVSSFSYSGFEAKIPRSQCNEGENVCTRSGLQERHPELRKPDLSEQ